jgi:hypothetical protein
MNLLLPAATELRVRINNRVARKTNVPLDQGRDIQSRLENELEGELHLPPALFANVASKITGVVDVTIWKRSVYAIQNVVSGEAELNIKRLADRSDWEVLKQRSIPVKLLTAMKYVSAQRSNVRTAWIAREDSCLCAAKGCTVKFQTLTLISRG